MAPKVSPDRSGSGSPAISVVVPTRNRAHMLPDCLESLAAQESAAPFEVVVVDNASTDDTGAVIDGWCRRDPRFRGVHGTTLGKTPALNAGMRAARGGLLLFTDDDAIVEPGWVETYRRFFEEHQEDLLIAGGPVLPVPRDLRWPSWFVERATVSIGAVDWGEHRRLGPAEHLWGANMAVPAAVFERLGTWNEAVGPRGTSHPRVDEPSRNEDTEFQARVNGAGGSVWFCPEAIVRHRTGIPGPRRCVAKGYANGRNEYWRVARGGGRADSRTTISARAPATVPALAADLARWLWWSVAFRARPSAQLFDHLWTAAWSAGSRVEELADRQSRNPSAARRVRVLVTGTARLALKIVPTRA